MWFKNVQVYTFTEEFSHSTEQMEAALAKFPFTPLSQLQETTFGWVAPFKDSDILVETVAGRIFLCAQIQDKILPASVINDYLLERLDALEEAEGRRAGKKEREQLKEDVRAELLPKAFHKTRRVSAWIDPKNKWLVVNASSEKSADDFTAQLREALGTLSVVPLGKSAAGGEILTGWYLDPTTLPTGTELEAEMELTMVQDPAVKAKYKNLDLAAPEIQLSLDSGMLIRQIAMAFADQCQFVLNEKFQLKRLKYQDKLVEQA
ncbi:MAG: recombination-associated protein RdgC, partial [Reinekea forsetii]|nr:recombination-associated protein RdgC [Reinekea forsetii]